MNRRHFIRALASALPAGAIATQVRSETDPVRALVSSLGAALAETAPEGTEYTGDLMVLDGSLLARAHPPGWRKGDMYAIYNSSKGGWRLTA